MAAENPIAPPPLRLLERPRRLRRRAAPAAPVPAWWQRWLGRAPLLSR